MYKITPKDINDFSVYLDENEKSDSTKQKYIKDVEYLRNWLNGTDVNKAVLLKYKSYLVKKYAPASVNAALSSINSFFEYMGWQELKLKTLKIQKQIFMSKEKELTKIEYSRLLKAAKEQNDKRLYLLMQTICACGIRVSELRYVTVEAVKEGVASINCKGKIRRVYIPLDLCRMLGEYIKERKILTGSVFVTRTGKPLDRSNIWSDMKKLCKIAGVSQNKVFPHNLRHLFARTYYSVQKDVVRLADILGHSNVNTTRIYTMETGEVHRRQIQKLGLLLC